VRDGVAVAVCKPPAVGVGEGVGARCRIEQELVGADIGDLLPIAAPNEGTHIAVSVAAGPRRPLRPAVDGGRLRAQVRVT